MPNWVQQLRKKASPWRFVGFVSGVVGFLCYALSSSFTLLFGKWNLLKIVLYTSVSFIICSIMLFPDMWKAKKSWWWKAHVAFLVLILISLYSFFYDKAVNQSKPDILSLISCAAFAFMSLSLSMQTELGFEVDLLNFFLGFLTLQLMKINLMLGIVGAAFCYSLIVLRSYLDVREENGAANDDSDVTLGDADVELGDANDSTGFQTDYNSYPNQAESLRRRLKGWPLTGLEQLRSGLLEQSKINLSRLPSLGLDSANNSIGVPTGHSDVEIDSTNAPNSGFDSANNSAPNLDVDFANNSTGVPTSHSDVVIDSTNTPSLEDESADNSVRNLGVDSANNTEFSSDYLDGEIDSTKRLNL